MTKHTVDLDELERLLKAATPGPWRVLDDDDTESDGTGILGGGEAYSIDEGQLAWSERQGGYFPDRDNAALIVTAVNSLPALIAAARRAEGLDYSDLWDEWQAVNDRATKAGSGFTRDQMTGASAMLGWLLGRLSAAAEREKE